MDNVEKCALGERVSIIVPVFNVEQYADQCIESIVRQTYPLLDIILIDDGSGDDSGKICDKWAAKDNRIRVIHQENKGVSGARNVGLEMARGEYVCFIDADDYVSSDYIASMIKVFQEKNVDLVSFKFLGEADGEYGTILDRQETVDCLFSNNKIGPYIGNKVFKKNIILDHNIFFMRELIVAEDLVFSYEYAKHISNCYYIEQDTKRFYTYRQRTDSAVVKRNLRKDRSNIVAYITILKDEEKPYTKETRDKIIQKYVGFNLHALLSIWKMKKKYDKKTYRHFMGIVSRHRHYLNRIDKSLFWIMRIFPRLFFLFYTYVAGDLLSRMAMNQFFKHGR